MHFKTLLWPGKISIIFCSHTAGTFSKTRQAQKWRKIVIRDFALHNKIFRSKQRLPYAFL
jgi:hypothetical protein